MNTRRTYLHHLLSCLFIFAKNPIVFANDDSFGKCMESMKRINNIPSVTIRHAALLKAFEDTCDELSLCFEDVEALTSLNPTDINPEYLYEHSPLVGIVKADFGGAFVYDPAYESYFDACQKNGGEVFCVNNVVDMEGSGGVQYDATGTPDNENGLDVDLEVYTEYFPICLPPECYGSTNDQLQKIMEVQFRDALLQSEKIKQQVNNPAVYGLLKEATFDTLCSISGLPTCDFTTEKVECPSIPQSSAEAKNLIVAALSILVGLMM